MAAAARHHWNVAAACDLRWLGSTRSGCVLVATWLRAWLGARARAPLARWAQVAAQFEPGGQSVRQAMIAGLGLGSGLGRGRLPVAGPGLAGLPAAGLGGALVPAAGFGAARMAVAGPDGPALAVAGLGGAVVAVTRVSLIRVPVAWSGGTGVPDGGRVPAGGALVAGIGRLGVIQVGRPGVPRIGVCGPGAAGPASAVPSSGVRPVQADGKKGLALLRPQLAGAWATSRWPA